MLQSEKLYKGIVLAALSLFCWLVEIWVITALLMYVLPALAREDEFIRTTVELLLAGGLVVNGIFAVGLAIGSYKALTSLRNRF